MTAPIPVQNIRRQLCLGCAAPCTPDVADPCAICPLTPPRWIRLGRCGAAVKSKPIVPVPPASPSITGLGDAVAVVAQPIARTIDRVLGTNVAGCGGCAKAALLRKQTAAAKELDNPTTSV